MKPNQRGRFNNRHNGQNRSSRPQTIFRNTSLESTGPCGKLRGTALQLHEKYMTAAKDALIQNDDVLAETCFQYADHYMHLQNLAIANEQSYHAQQQAQRAALAEESTAETAEDQSSADPLPTDGDLKVMDLSVPVASMNKAAEAASTPSVQESAKPRRKLRLHHTDSSPSEPNSDEISG